MSALPYSTGAERTTSFARAFAGVVTGAAGAWLLLVSWGAHRWALVALGAIGCLACLGWFVAARRGSRRAKDATGWRLVADSDGVHSVGGDVEPRAWSEIAEISVDEETLEVVLSPAPRVSDASPVRIAPCWGDLGAYELAAWLDSQRPRGVTSSARPGESG